MTWCLCLGVVRGGVWRLSLVRSTGWCLGEVWGKKIGEKLGGLVVEDGWMVSGELWKVLLVCVWEGLCVGRFVGRCVKTNKTNSQW